MPAPSVIPGIIAAVQERIKQLEFDGQQYGSGEGLVHYNEIVYDQWYPQVGFGPIDEYEVPVSGNYRIYLEGRMPGFAAPGIGWPNGWSGEGGGELWIRTLRGAGILEDNISKQGWSSADAGTENWMYCGPVTRTLLAGDKICGRFTGGGTGLGPSLYNVKLVMTKLKS